jgi:hypothetical protein
MTGSVAQCRVSSMCKAQGLMASTAERKHTHTHTQARCLMASIAETHTHTRHTHTHTHTHTPHPPPPDVIPDTWEAKAGMSKF